ncbi:MAG TPA: efflux RND transporter periplasmic adaptor subunit [Limnobacter sp.]|nr:efflux RND transporter periplasmic adaptor subunit [Limnobacter sp.]
MKQVLALFVGLACHSLVQAASQCLIEPSLMVDLASPVSGVVQKVSVKRGDLVGKGQTLAFLDSRAEQAAAALAEFKSRRVAPIEVAQSKVEFATQRFSRKNTLAKEKLMSQQESNDAESELRMAESELKAALEDKQQSKLELEQQKTQIELKQIRSPFAGVVVEQGVYPGEFLDPASNNKPLFKIAQLNPLKVRLVLPKESFGKVKVGAQAELVPEVPGNTKYMATVKTVDRLIDAASGSYVVLLELKNPNSDIPSGVRCKASIPGL